MENSIKKLSLSHIRSIGREYIVHLSFNVYEIDLREYLCTIVNLYKFTFLLFTIVLTYIIYIFIFGQICSYIVCYTIQNWQFYTANIVRSVAERVTQQGTCLRQVFSEGVILMQPLGCNIGRFGPLLQLKKSTFEESITFVLWLCSHCRSDTGVSISIKLAQSLRLCSCIRIAPLWRRKQCNDFVAYYLNL